MRHSRFDWHERIRAIEREYGSVRVAVDRLSEVADHDPDILGTELRPRDLTAADENLEATYLIRMFAEFETAIRSFWKSIRPKARTQTEALVDRVGDRCSIPIEVVRDAQVVRVYRNKLVHDRDQECEPMTIKVARHRLAIYLASLPREWGG
jgi:hypothetical protein